MQKMTAPFPPDVARYLDSIGSRKRTAFVETIRACSAQPRLLASYWDGGSRDEWALFKADGKRAPLSVVTSPPQFGGTAPAYVPAPGDVLIRAGTFAGRPSTPHVTFYVD